MKQETLVSLDPGKNLAWAFYSGQELRDCGIIRDAFDHQKLVADFPLFVSGTTFIAEKPQVYQGRKQVGDPNDLIDLAVQVGVMIGARPWSKTILVRPRTWKGTVPKEITRHRVLEALGSAEKFALDAGRVGPASIHHNLYDAVAIGLWHLGRYR